jgi:hypothetical protein
MARYHHEFTIKNHVKNTHFSKTPIQKTPKTAKNSPFTMPKKNSVKTGLG